MTRHYEIVYVFDSELEEPQVNEHLDRFHALLASPDAPEPVNSVNHWGKRQLAYPIRGKETGYYVITVLPEFERAIKLDDQVMRHLLVLNEGEAPRPPRGQDDDESSDTDDNEEND